MTFCCEHSKKAYELMNDAFSSIERTSSEEITRNSVGQVFRTFIPFASIYDKHKLHNAIDSYKSWMSDSRKKITEAEKEMAFCHCAENERMINRGLNDKLGWLEERVSDMTKLIEKNKSEIERLELENGRIERDLTVSRQNIADLRVSDTRNRINAEFYEELYEDVRGRLDTRETQLEVAGALITNLAVERERAEVQLINTENQLITTSGRLETRETQLEVAQTWLNSLQRDNTLNEMRANFREEQLGQIQNDLERKNNQLETARNLILILQDSITNLQVENSGYESEITRLRREIDELREELEARITPLELQELINNLRLKDEEIQSLKERIRNMEEENLDQHLNSSENKLEKLIRRYNLSQFQKEVIRTLIEAYQDLEEAKESRNRRDVSFYLTSIREAKRLIFDENIDGDQLKEITDICQEIAKSQWRLTNQFEAHIEIPPHGNNNVY